MLLLLPSVVPSTRWARPSSLETRVAVTFARCRKIGAGNPYRKQEAGKVVVQGLGGPKSEYYFLSQPQVLQWNRGVSSRPEPPSAAILVVYLDRAQDLPVSLVSMVGEQGPWKKHSPPPLLRTQILLPALLQKQQCEMQGL